MLVHRRVTPSIKFAGTHLYTWVETDTVGVKCLVQEHNAMSPDGARTQTAGSGDERTDHEVTAPPTIKNQFKFICVYVTSKHISLRELKQGRSNLAGGCQSKVGTVMIKD